MSVTILKSSNQILAGLLRGDDRFRLNVLYVEFQQGTGKVTDLPTVDPADSDYYLRLRDNKGSSRDFLRIPVVAVTPVVGENPNEITLLFNGICVGTTGVGEKPTDSSMIYGVALAASPTYGTSVDDLTRDVIWARGYYVPERQIPFSLMAQTAITFKINLTN